MLKRIWRVGVVAGSVLLAVCLAAPVWAMSVEVRGLFNGSAIVVVNGKQHLLKKGQKSPEGIELIEATSKFAIVNIAGEQRKLTMTQRIAANFQEATTREVRLSSVAGGHYITPARINERTVNVMVDTGATTVAMSSRDARTLGIDYRKGEPARVSTASGIANAYRVMLNSVAVGSVVVNNVEALVTDGNFPEIILLGNTYLSRVQMTQDNGVLILETKY